MKQLYLEQIMISLSNVSLEMGGGGNTTSLIQIWEVANKRSPGQFTDSAL